ncbi:MAG TPA: ABC transporter ATP-binding protein [Candidatus Sumerlaeota bacterium]|nr:ABC transporter ATP-binding protein [Candidatus Sumerlaeota bacterium]HON49791.1 ABC transporter ATP-binding protein [Candidatus Sumerlaeota bacterium]HOR63961.1 ABC transporter ATP-binding protein [Candidatus Sumerlaeota bacterium]HPL75109.1 ABC transporter ATP-binding protein [Candidatus Sumerlaeota bacterium]HRU54836.1 ABC transporter ATP-binding protein [Candidatus Sumerlaeia bacterium]
MDNALIRIENLTKNFEEVCAVKNLSLTIPAGEVFAFLGPNGAGKTTTIKAMTGLLRPTHGRAIIGGYDIQEQPFEAKRLIGYIPDHPYVYEKLSGVEFFRFIGDLFGVPRDIQEKRMEQYFQIFSLMDARDKLIENYSHGMRQKLVMSISLMHDPKALVIDEPMVGLDPQSMKIVKRLFRETANKGAAVFLSTHLLSVAEEVADRIGLIHKGQLIFLGTLEEMRRFARREGNLEDLFLELTAG